MSVESSSESEVHPFGTYEEKVIVSLAFDVPEFYMTILKNIEPKDFQLFETRFLITMINNYINKKDIVPTREIIYDRVSKILSANDNCKAVLDLIERRSNPREVKLIKSIIIDWARSKAFGKLYDDEALTAYEKRDFSKIEKIFDEATKITENSGKGLWFFNSTDILFEESFDQKMTTGFTKLDHYLNDGGPAKKEVLCYAANTGVGKCHTLDTDIIIENWSNIYQIDFSDDIRYFLQGFKKVNTNYGDKMICELTEKDRIISVYDEINDDHDLILPEIDCIQISPKIIKLNRYKCVKFGDIINDYESLKILTPDGFTPIKAFSFIKRDITYKIFTQFGSIICHPFHKVMTQNGEKFVVNLLNHDKLMSYHGYISYFKISPYKEEDLYDIEIESPHLYYTSGIVSHNSIALVNSSVANIKKAQKVLHFSLEMSDRRTAQRYASCFASVKINEHKKHKESLTDKLSKIKSTYNGDLIIYEFPPDEISVNEIYQTTDSLQRLHNWKPDVIVIDYLECMLSRRKSDNENDYLKQKNISTQIRGLAKNLDVLVLTATQTNREPGAGKDSKKKDDFTPAGLNRLAESYGKSMPMDYVITINQSRDEYKSEVPKLRLFIAKNRNGKKEVSITVGMNYEMMKMQQEEVEKI